MCKHNERNRWHNVHDGSRETDRFADRFGRAATERELGKATFGRGALAGKTGNPFKDDAFFNPWAKGGSFNP